MRLPPGASLLDALRAVGLEASAWPAGIWGRRAERSQLLRDGDRVELYRSLLVDPKVARRQRFARQGARGAGLFAGIGMGHQPAVCQSRLCGLCAGAVVLAHSGQFFLLLLSLGLCALGLLGFIGRFPGLQVLVNACAGPRSRFGGRRGGRAGGGLGGGSGLAAGRALQNALGGHLRGRWEVAEHLAPLLIHPLPLRLNAGGKKTAGAQQDKHWEIHGGR
ncbi:Persistence and stress-resistance antitoxin PasI [compost metagenome]